MNGDDGMSLSITGGIVSSCSQSHPALKEIGHGQVRRGRAEAQIFAGRAAGSDRRDVRCGVVLRLP